MLSQRYRVAIRRHLGIPFANTAQAGRLFGWRFAIHVEDLEYKMSNMAPNEEQLITGYAVGSWQVSDQPSAGDVLLFTVTDANGIHQVPYTVTTADLNPAANITNPAEASPTFSIALNAASKVNQALNALGYTASAAMPADLFSPQYFPPFFSQVIITGPSSTLFTIGAQVTGTTNFIVGDPVYPCPVNQNIQGVPTYGYVAILDAIQNRVPSADLTLWIEKADVVTFRKDEVRARLQLYRTMCEFLSRDLGGKEYVEHFGGSGGGAIA